jgi:hypothetical protein
VTDISQLFQKFPIWKFVLLEEKEETRTDPKVSRVQISPKKQNKYILLYLQLRGFCEKISGDDFVGK